MNNLVLFLSVFAMLFVFSFSIDDVLAYPHSGQVLINDHTHEYKTKIHPSSGVIGLEKSTIYFYSSKNNTLP